MQTSTWDIHLDNLRIGYGDKVVLSDLTMTFPAGQISMVMGGSGCGKSTLLRHIIGLNRPQHGRILVGKQDLFALSGRNFRHFRRRMGVLFQDGALLGALSLLENVALPLTEHTSLPLPTITEVALHTLSLVGLEEFGAYYPNELSGGMRKRAGLARAIITNPPILLCDEPTSGLDPINAAQMDSLLLAMKERFPSMSIVVVSHDLQSLFRIADQVMVLHDGTMLFSGTPGELKNHDSPYLQKFLNRSTLATEKFDASVAIDYTLRPEIQQAVAEQLDAWLTR